MNRSGSSSNSEVVTFQVKLTYSELEELINSSSLVPGMQYRITDYVTIVEDREIDSAGHPFDVIVTAMTEDTLYPDARASLHDGDNYFRSENLEAWHLRYAVRPFNNYTDSWYPSTGKGIIYYMEDEYGNKADFDFKNIRFSIPQNFFTFPDNSNFKDNVYGSATPKSDLLCYLFSRPIFSYGSGLEIADIVDASISQADVASQISGFMGVKNNSVFLRMQDYREPAGIMLGNVVFILNLIDRSPFKGVRNNTVIGGGDVWIAACNMVSNYISDSGRITLSGNSLGDCSYNTLVESSGINLSTSYSSIRYSHGISGTSRDINTINAKRVMNYKFAANKVYDGTKEIMLRENSSGEIKEFNLADLIV